MNSFMRSVPDINTVVFRTYNDFDVRFICRRTLQKRCASGRLHVAPCLTRRRTVTVTPQPSSRRKLQQVPVVARIAAATAPVSVASPSSVSGIVDLWTRNSAVARKADPIPYSGRMVGGAIA